MDCNYELLNFLYIKQGRKIEVTVFSQVDRSRKNPIARFITKGHRKIDWV